MEKIRRLLDGARYWELREEDIVTTQTSAWNGTIKDVASAAKQGTSIRVLYGNGWGFAHSTEKDYEHLAKRALALAKAMNNPCGVLGAPIIKKDVTSRYAIHPEDISLEEKRDLVLKASKQPDAVKNLRVLYKDNQVKKFYANSEGTEIRQNLYYTYYGAEATAGKGDRMESAYKAFGALRGYEITKGLQEKVDEACTVARNLLTASIPKGGQYPVITDGALTSVFIHEALGHAAEADNLLSDSTCLKGQEGKLVGSEPVTVYDDGTVEDSWGSFFFDDEGVAAHKTRIMDKGVFRSYLHSRETAARASGPLTGNARAQGTEFIPIVRMSNTYVEPGTADFDDMVDTVRNGVYLRGSKGGQVNPITGDFQFSAQDGFMIKNGELAGYLRAVSLAGNVLHIIKNIELVQDKFEDGFPGHCGKNGQSVPVHGDNPSLFISKAVVGGG
ncbi:TldD/PmbA family protein [Candidatus Woesearchaeota archaeon]|nr:TldD/PmbA family protein [Candidatus Woesearchaeota archaeon]